MYVKEGLRCRKTDVRLLDGVKGWLLQVVQLAGKEQARARAIGKG